MFFFENEEGVKGRLGLLRKFIRFLSVTRPLDCMKKWSRLFISLLFQTWPELREGGEGTELEALADPGVEMPWTSCSCTKSSPSCTLSCTSSRWSPSSGGGRRGGRAPGRDRTCSRARSSSWAWARAGWCAGAWHHFVKGTPSLKRAIMMIDFVETQIIYFPSLNFPPHTSITKRIKWIGILNMRSLFFLGRDFSKWNAAIFLEYFQTAADLLCNCEVLLWNGIGFTWCCSCRSVVTAFKLFYFVGAAFKHHPSNEVGGGPFIKNTLPIAQTAFDPPLSSVKKNKYAKFCPPTPFNGTCFQTSFYPFCVTRAPLLYFIKSWVALSFKVCEWVSQSLRHW